MKSNVNLCTQFMNPDKKNTFAALSMQGSQWNASESLHTSDLHVAICKRLLVQIFLLTLQ